MKSLNEDIKNGQLKQVYLLTGDEAYLRKQYKDKLKNALVSADDTMNYAYFEGKSTDVGTIIELAETMPFFAERRLILVEDSGFMKTSSGELADYLKEMPETTHMVFVESEVDKRSKLYKAVQSAGRVVEFGTPDEMTLLRWIAGNVKKEKKQITENAARYFLAKVGTDMENIQAELEKLFCYTMDKEEITTADIDAICVTQITNQIFDMVDAVATKNQKKALEYYYDLLALKEPPARILFLLGRHFKQLLEVKTMALQNYSRKEIAEKLGLMTFVVGKSEGQARAFKVEELRNIMEDCVDTEECIKTGRLADVLGVELFITKYSAK